MKIHFQLDRPSAKRSPIMMTYRHNGFRFRYSTGHSVDTIDWDKIREEEKSKIGTSIINSTINQLRTVFDKMMVFYLSGEGKHPSRSEMKEYLDRHYKEKQNPAKKRIEPDSICLINYFEQLLKLWGANGRVKPSTIVVYNRSLNILKKALGETLPSNHLNKKTIETIVKYMRSRKKEDSYIKKTLETIKTLVNYAIDDVNLTGITENPVQTKDYGLKDRASDKIYLYQDEVDSIAALDLSNDQRRDIVRDIFLLATYTGPRFSDVNTDAKWEIGTDENGRSFLKYRSIKTDKLSMLPLKSEAVAILSKYPVTFPSRSNAEINRMIKEIGEMAGISQIVIRTEHRDGEVLTIRSPKYSQIEMHTSRRTFCTLAVRAGVATRTIMFMSGHETESSFNRYVRHNEEEAMQDAMKYDFFK